MISRHSEIYVNLTNGLEFLQPFVEECEKINKPTPFKVIRIQSTWLEQHHWDYIMSDLDSDLLLHLALGDNCIILDCGSRFINADSTEPCPSRAQWMGIPLIKYILDRLWFGITPKSVIVRDKNVVKLFSEIYDKGISSRTITKLNYFKKYIPEEADCVHLSFKSKQSTHDSEYSWFAEIAQSVL